jgi:hypothetical protein
MKLSQNELRHVVFLAETVFEGNKRAMIPPAAQCLLYIVKSLEDVEMPDAIQAEIRRLVDEIEDQLKSENDRLREISGNLNYFNHRSPLGK